MRKSAKMVLAMMAALTVSTAFAGTTWRWKEGGKWVYGDHYPRNAENPERWGPQAEAPTKPSATFQNEQAKKLFPVVVYGVDCPACDEGKKLLDARKVPAVYKDAKLMEVYEEFKKVSPNSQAPVIVVGEKPFVGFEASAWNKALDDAGYEKAAPVAGVAPIPPVAPAPPKK